MKKNSPYVLGLMLASVLMGTGCQTFSLTKEEWERQQRGEMADPDVGGAMDFLGIFLAPPAAAIATGLR